MLEYDSPSSDEELADDETACKVGEIPSFFFVFLFFCFCFCFLFVFVFVFFVAKQDEHYLQYHLQDVTYSTYYIILP